MPPRVWICCQCRGGKGRSSKLVPLAAYAQRRRQNLVPCFRCFLSDCTALDSFYVKVCDKRRREVVLLFTSRHDPRMVAVVTGASTNVLRM